MSVCSVFILTYRVIGHFLYKYAGKDPSLKILSIKNRRMFEREIKPNDL